MNHLDIAQKPRHRPDPFDPSANSRLQRAGLLMEDGSICSPAIQTLACSFAGLFYDELCDNCTEYETILNMKQQLTTAQASGLPKRKLFLSLCVFYDNFFKPIPDAMWWMAGNDQAIACFIDAYIVKFSDCCAKELVEDMFSHKKL